MCVWNDKEADTARAALLPLLQGELACSLQTCGHIYPRHAGQLQSASLMQDICSKSACRQQIMHFTKAVCDIPHVPLIIWQVAEAIICDHVNTKLPARKASKVKPEPLSVSS